MVGAAIAGAGWRRRTALATTAGIIAANIPDVDIVTAEAGDYASLALRRGWTHGPPAVLLGAVITVGVILLYDRLWRRRRNPDADPVRTLPLFMLSLVAALTHPLLDWMNTYGIRFLMPFDRAWYYGDSLFIIDPWLWLLLGIPLFLVHARTALATGAWTFLGVLMTVVVVATQFVPLGAKIGWLVLLAAAALLHRSFERRGIDPARIALAAVMLATLYVGAMVASSSAAAALVRRDALARGITPARVMVAPLPARPGSADLVIDDGHDYHFGSFAWLASPRVDIAPGALPRGEMDDVARAAATHPDARDFLVWSRFPIIVTQADADGWIVRFGDARYVDGPDVGALRGVAIRVDRSLNVSR